MIFIQSVYDSVLTNFTNPSTIISIFWKLNKIILIIIFSRIIIKVVDLMIKRLVDSRKNRFIILEPRRAETLKNVLHNLVAYTIFIISSILILSQLGINIAPILAGAGIAGLAIGFGAQSLVRDVISGFFIILEDQYGLGDVVEIDEFKGIVEEVGIRVTKIRRDTGEQLIIPNGNIKKVINHSTYNSIAKVDISVASHSDIDKSLRLLEEIADEMFQTNRNLVSRPIVQGVQLIGNTALTLRVKLECIANKQNEVIREMNAMIKKQFDTHRIELQ